MFCSTWSVSVLFTSMVCLGGPTTWSASSVPHAFQNHGSIAPPISFPLSSLIRLPMSSRSFGPCSTIEASCSTNETYPARPFLIASPRALTIAFCAFFCVIP